MTAAEHYIFVMTTLTCVALYVIVLTHIEYLDASSSLSSVIISNYKWIMLNTATLVNYHIYCVTNPLGQFKLLWLTASILSICVPISILVWRTWLSRRYHAY